MRALSIRQPYAELILRGIKTIEYRTRRTRIIGERFYIYAARTPGDVVGFAELASKGDGSLFRGPVCHRRFRTEASDWTWGFQEALDSCSERSVVRYVQTSPGLRPQTSRLAPARANIDCGPVWAILGLTMYLRTTATTTITTTTRQG